ncbi:MAG TPA: tetratricopeptide repeat protein, partial [Terriglobales bacterium]|nr:tetratricopeptide repeat protein [Terriglobales bacterium]
RAVKAAPQNGRLWFLVGYTSRLAGHYQASLEAYRRGLQVEPNSPDGVSGMAQTYSRMGNAAEAIRILSQLVAANPKRTEDTAILGELYMRSGNMPQALNLLQRAEADKPTAHSELLMATAYLKMKQPQRAKELLDKAKRRDPNNADIFRAVANYYRETRDYPTAIATLKSAPRRTPDLLADLAYTYELSGDKKEAAANYLMAADAAPGKIGFQLSAAQAQFLAGNVEKADPFLQRASALDQSHYRLHAIRAAMAKSQQRPEEAIREYNFAISHLPEAMPEGQLYPIQLRLNLSELYKEQGNQAAAQEQIALAEKAISAMQVEGPAKAEFLRVRAAIKAGSNDLPGAEADLQQAMALDPQNLNINLQYATLLWKTQRKEQAHKLYSEVLAKDPKNRFALEGLGYLSREMNDNKAAEQFFKRLAATYPDDYVAYLALGDLYTSTRDFQRADDSYREAAKHAPKNPIIIANAANAAIEARQYPLAARWLERASGTLADDPHVMLERERWLFHTGKYAQSAQLGEKVLAKLPRDRNASVYLVYALYNLGRYDDVLKLTSRYASILPKEPNFPLLAGHVHKQSQLLDEAVEDYSRAAERDPGMIEAYINRGYVLNDLQNPESAVQDFNTALKLNPNNGTAHLGLAFSDLQFHRGRQALEQVDLAERLMGESGATHLARATAYRYMRLMDKAEKEYRIALKYSPDDLKLNMALADTLYHMRRYNNALAAFQALLRLSPDDPLVYAQMAHCDAYLHRRAETMRYIQLAEQTGGEQSSVLLATGDALMVLGDRNAAMERFERALEAPDADRVSARLAIAKLFVHDGKLNDAREQVGLAFAEARVGEANPVTADDFIEAANIFLAMHDFNLASRYYRKARDAGAADEAVAIGMANAYLAQGDSINAQAQLAALGSPADYENNYDYQLAMGQIYQQRHDPMRALTAFAHATVLSPEEDTAEKQMELVAGEEGWHVNNRVSLLSELESHPIFDDPTIYMMDAKLFGITNPALLPPPRAPIETLTTTAYRFHQPGVPLLSGFFQIRNARGAASLPSLGIILNRSTYDYNFNGAINPVLRMGRYSLQFNTGLQYTIRRDTEAPVAMNENLFRQFVNVSTSSFFNWIQLRGSAYHEAGPFTQRPLSSKDVGAHLEFTVGRPWGKTALITGYAVRDLQFSPLIREYFTTASYAGFERKFMNQKLRVSALGEYIRAWRVQDALFATGQAVRPAARVEYAPNNRWSAEASFAYSRGMSLHDYDNMQSGFFISYVKPWRRMLNDATGEVPVEYPLRFSFGIQSQEFGNFAGRGQAQVRPVIRLTLF